MNTPPCGRMADGIVSPAPTSQISTEGTADVTGGDDVTKTDNNGAAGDAVRSGDAGDQQGSSDQPLELMQGDQTRSSPPVNEPCGPLPVSLTGSGEVSADNNLDVDGGASSSSTAPTDRNPSVTSMAPEPNTDSVLSASAAHVIGGSSSPTPSKVPFQSKLQTALLSATSSLLPALQFSQPNVLSQDVVASSADAATRPGTSRPLKCPHCNWHYKYTETLQTHIMEEHAGDGGSCHTCLTGRPHPRLPRGEAHRCGYKPYRCEVCKYATTTKGNLRIHIQSDKHFYNTRALQRKAAEEAGTVRGCRTSETAGNEADVKERLSGAVSPVNGTAVALGGEAGSTSCSEKEANGARSVGTPPQCLRPATEPGPSKTADPVTDEVPKNSMIRRLLEIGPRPDPLRSRKCDLVPARPPKLPSPTPVFACWCCKSFSSNSIEHLDEHWQQTHSKTGAVFHPHTATNTDAVSEADSAKTGDAKEQIPSSKCSPTSAEKKPESVVIPGSDSTCSDQLHCNLCDYRASSVASLREHASVAEHDARLVLLRHLQEAEIRLSNPAGLIFECLLCGFSSHHKLPLLWHIGSVDHLAQEHERQLKRQAEGRRGGGDIEEIFTVRAANGNSGHNASTEDRIGNHSAREKQKEPWSQTGHPSLGSLTPAKCKPEKADSIKGSLSSMNCDTTSEHVSDRTNSDSCSVSGTLQDGTGSGDHSTNGDGVLSLKEPANHQKEEHNHHENRPYKCQECHVAYAHPQILNIHLNSQLHCSNILKMKSGAPCAQSVQNVSGSLLKPECGGIRELKREQEEVKTTSKCRDPVKGDVPASPDGRESDTPRAVSRPASAAQHKLLQELGLDIVLHHGENSRKRQKVILQDQEQDSMDTSDSTQDLQSTSDTNFVCVVCQKHFTNALILKVHEEEVHKLLLADHVLDGFAQRFAQELQNKREADSDAGLTPKAGTETANTRDDKAQDAYRDSQLGSMSPSPVDLRSESQSQKPQSQTGHLQVQHLASYLVRKGPKPQDQHLLKTTLSTAPKAASTPETTSILKRLVEQKPVARPAGQQIRQATAIGSPTSVAAGSPSGSAEDYVTQMSEVCRGAADFPAALSFLQAAQLHYQLQQLSALGATVGADAQQAALGPLMAAQQMWAAYTMAAQQQAAATVEALNVPEHHAEEKVSSKRSRTRISAQQVTVLRAYFDVDPSPPDDQVTGLAVCCGLPPKVVKQWFRNTLFKERQKHKDAPSSDDSSAQATERGTSGDLCSTEGSLPTVLPSVTPEVANHNVLTSFKTKDSGLTVNESSETKEISMKVAGFGVNCSQNTVGSSQGKTTPHQLARHPSPEVSNSRDETSLPVNLMAHAPRASPTEELRISFASCAPTSYFPTTSNSPTSSTSSELSPVLLGDQNNGARRASRTRFSNRQVKELQQAFEQNAYPKDDELVRLSERLGLCVRVITVWFQNARQKARRVFENQSSPKAAGVVAVAAEHKCDRCERVFRSHLELVLHQNEPCQQALSASSVDARGVRSPVIRVDENADTGKSMATPQNNTYQCNKCSQRFTRFDQWREHDASHVKSPSPVSSPLQNQSSEGLGAEPRTGAGNTPERVGSTGSQRQDMRVRTVINAEALEYLHRQYRLDPSPSRDVVEGISRHIGIKKRVVQVWFQNARARERKSQANGQQNGAQNRVTDQTDVSFSTGSSVDVGSQSIIQQQMQAYMEALVAAQQVTMGMTANGPIDRILGIPGLGYPPGFYGPSLAPAECEEAPLDLSKPQKSPGKSIFVKDPSDRLSSTKPQLDAIRSDSVSIVPVFATTSQSQHQALDLAAQPSLQQQQSQQQPKQPCQKRFRTQMSATQVAVLRSVFNAYKMPTMLECMRLGERIGLAKRVVQVWFQNSRAKQKKRQLLRNDERALTPPPQGCEYCSVAYDDKCKAQEHVLSDCHVTSVCRVSKVTGLSGGGAGAGQRPREVSGPSEEERSRQDPPQGDTSHAPQSESETTPPSER